MKRALTRSQDPELADLYDALTKRRERVAALELELFEARAELAAFSAKVEARLGPLQDELEALENEVRNARRAAARRAQWGERAERDEVPYDVLEEFERTWRRSPPSPEKAPKKSVSGREREEIKELYRALAKRFHPDLTTDADEKKYRVGVMAEVNEAYAAGNLAKLKELQDKPDRPEQGRDRSRSEVMADLRAEIRRLDGVIHQLQSALDRLTRSAEVSLMLDASIAERQGRDLLAEMAVGLKAEIAELKAELAELE